MNTTMKVLLGFAILVALIFGGNWLSVGAPVSEALNSDYRNDGIEMSARHALYLSPGSIVLDLRSIEDASPADLGRALFQAAGSLQERSFSRVVLSNRRTPVFQMDGDDFQDIGRQFTYGQNPIYLVRKLPSKLYEPDGRAAFGSWSGGLLGVVGKEMEDYNEAMGRWAHGE